MSQDEPLHAGLTPVAPNRMAPEIQPDSALPRLDSRALFRNTREIVIVHDGADYRLRLTANGKLILTK